jgi:lysophospholipase L1-like esterase
MADRIANLSPAGTEPTSAEPGPRTKRALGTGLAASAATLLLVLLAIEAYLRWKGYEPLAAGRRTSYHGLFVRASEDARMRYELTPGARGRGWDCDIEINAAGFRDRDYSESKPPGTRRIVALGDSITFGNFLEAGETWPKRLEETLQADGRPIEVLNLGVTGYDTLQMVAFLERTGLAFDPDLVVIGFCLNDNGTASVELSYIERLQRYGSWIYRSRIAQWLRFERDKQLLRRGYHDFNREDRFLERNRGEIDDISHDAALLARMGTIEASIRRVGEPLPSYVPINWYGSRAHMGKFRFAFRSLAELVERRRVPVLIVILTYLREAPFEEAHDLVYALITDESRAFGFDVLDLAPTVRAAGPESLMVDPEDDTHYNAKGHALIARAIAAHLVTSGFTRE